MAKTKNIPGIIYRNGKPSAVVLDIEDYKELLEKLEDIEDLKMLSEMRSEPLEFTKLEDYLGER
ncbi:MAG: hypothetical protein A2979_00030 [Deltaproteobacteria bacterium RIFCSPLOWO2_01_FULL_45_74]|nr:MAG: hypothetical protein A2712_04775 [Deltaproteobacteria bacterium RIFCSPHIGHO2_01_FULL_43_49]OGQ15355.1 MAG: hypothetical protein A3D22_07840 [Deltaproteobacteria bacterium RIFCSPHIGHO2_02_FULL_44_53]OGQ31465.1 MAG: hypothetical protein A2979_00030 [Deltaproteobacteria bacterium RIFCSPLOWO2_01_FULL_45_74]OGQ42712.1 MAG: hypothetical protein A3I70_03925 [Deltaproteobacteria bacterium RIFCSPLOWO2_02_FULL_44_34]